MHHGDRGLSPSIASILPKELADGLPAVPSDHERRVEQQRVPSFAEPVVELEVLVRPKGLVPSVHAPQECGGIRAERDVLDGSGGRRVVVPGVPHAEPRLEGSSDGAAGGVPPPRLAALWIPLGRVGDIEDVARAALFLASDEATWITGAVLRVDRGIVVQ